MTMRLCSTNGEVTDSSNLGRYKSNSKKLCTETNHLKSFRKSNLNRLIFAHLNINPFETNSNSLRKIC